MNKPIPFGPFMVAYHAVQIVAAILVCRMIARRGQETQPLERVAIALSAFVMLESINFLWLVACAERLFDIRGQGLEVGRLHLWYVGPIFVVGFVSSFFVKSHRPVCLAFSLSYLVLGALAILVV